MNTFYKNQVKLSPCHLTSITKPNYVKLNKELSNLKTIFEFEMKDRTAVCIINYTYEKL